MAAINRSKSYAIFGFSLSLSLVRESMAILPSFDNELSAEMQIWRSLEFKKMVLRICR